MARLSLTEEEGTAGLVPKDAFVGNLVILCAGRVHIALEGRVVAVATVVPQRCVLGTPALP